MSDPVEVDPALPNPAALYFVARTDLSDDSGQQRVFAAYSDETSCVAAGTIISHGRAGQFAVFKGTAIVTFDQEIGPVTATPVGQT